MTGSDPRWMLRLLRVSKGHTSTYPVGVPKTCGVGWIDRGLGVRIFERHHGANATFRWFFWFHVIVCHPDALLAS